jgi:hypothetical protein
VVDEGARGLVGLSPRRLAELIVTTRGGQSRGSGYRVTSSAVLTAAHVVADAVRVEVRFDADRAGEWSAVAESWWVDPESDVAIVSIYPRPGEAKLSPARFGRIGDENAIIDVHCVGFPRWKLRNADGTVPAYQDQRERFRDTAHITGTVRSLSNRREGTIEVFLDAAPAAEPVAGDQPHRSPWEGMSGATLWAGDRVVGVIAKHHPGDGLNTLAASRLDTAFQRPEVRNLLGLPPEPLPDVLNVLEGSRVLEAYRAEVRSIAPRQLRDRERELDELSRFVSGDQPYSWWQAGLWAGKTALLAWFVLHPPPAVDVVSFFITSRFAGESDSDAFTRAVTEQLSALAREPPPFALDTREARHRHLAWLLGLVARRSAELGRRLLLVVDGLDEDTSLTRRGEALRSIASLLPASPPEGLRVLAASRAHPGLPSDVDGNHVLRTTPVRQLEVSPHARHAEVAAKHELAQLLRGDDLPRDVLGVITAAGGGLTLSDLEELTGHPRYEIARQLDGPLGRTIAARASTSQPDDHAQPVYLFAHVTLRDIADEQFGHTLETYRDRLHGWAEQYRARGWPAETPTYLLRGYSSMLTATRDTPRLFVTAHDRRRRDRLLELVGGDAAALSENAAARLALIEQPAPDLGQLIGLALDRDFLIERNERIPTRLPAAWITIGYPHRATALIDSITETYTRLEAMTALVAAALRVGDPDLAQRITADAERQAAAISDDDARAEQLLAIGTAWFEAGDPRPAEQLMSSMRGNTRARSLAILCAAAAARGDDARARAMADEADRLAHEFAREADHATMAAELAELHAEIGDFERARALIDEIATVKHRNTTLARLARIAATACEAERSLQFVNAVTDFDERTGAQVARYMGLAISGIPPDNPGYADLETVAAEVTDPSVRVGIAIDLAVVSAATGHTKRALDRFREAERITSATMTYIPRLDRKLWSKASRKMVAAAGAEKAVSFAEAITGVLFKDELQSGIVNALAESGESEWTDRVIQTFSERSKAEALVTIAVAGTMDQEHAMKRLLEAEKVARLLSVPASRSAWMSEWCVELIISGEHDRPQELATRITNTEDRTDVAQRIFKTLVQMGCYEDALAMARTRLSDYSRRDAALSQIAIAAAVSGTNDGLVARIADEIRDPDVRDALATAIVELRVKSGEIGGLNHLVERVNGFEDRAYMSAVDAWLYAVRGSYRRSRRLVARTAERVRRVSDPGRRAKALACLAATLKLVGNSTEAERFAADADEATAGVLDAEDRAEILITIAAYSFQAGDTDRAFQLARTATTTLEDGVGFASSDPFRDLAEWLTRDGNFELAVQAARHVDDWAPPGETLARVADGLARSGMYTQVQAVIDVAARKIADWPDDFAIRWLRYQISWMYASIGRHKAAEAYVDDIDDVSTRMWVRALVAERYLEAGDRGRAQQIADRVTSNIDLVADHELRSDCLLALARVAVKSEDMKRAQHLIAKASEAAWKVADAEDRADALSRIACILLDIDHEGYPMDRTGARRVIAHIFATDRWIAALRPAARLDQIDVVAVSAALAGWAKETA